MEKQLSYRVKVKAKVTTEVSVLSDAGDQGMMEAVEESFRDALKNLDIKTAKITVQILSKS